MIYQIPDLTYTDFTSVAYVFITSRIIKDEYELQKENDCMFRGGWFSIQTITYKFFFVIMFLFVFFLLNWFFLCEIHFLV